MENNKNNVHDLSPKIARNNLSPEQESYWYQKLEDAERAVEYAKRMLKIGKYATEKGAE